MYVYMCMYMYCTCTCIYVYVHAFIYYKRIFIHSCLLLDKSMIPKRIHAVTGVSLLWQPEVMFPYLALLEKFTSTPELMEAAAGAIQNLTACAWKVCEKSSSVQFVPN